MQPLTGFRDFLPAACAERNYIFAKWREVAGRYGFVEFDGPVLEELDLYQKKSGDEIVRQLYEFVDKGERPVALRPEMTPTLARIVAEQHRQFRKPLKWLSIPQVFRYERPQRGRLRGAHAQDGLDGDQVVPLPLQRLDGLQPAHVVVVVVRGAAANRRPD